MLAQLKTVVLIKEAIKLAFSSTSGASGASAFVGSMTGSKWPEVLSSETRQPIPSEKLPRN
jgi:hypothetical protein